jgi:hypothetical protein
MFCTNCGASNKDDAKFCINCGESLSEIHIEEKRFRSRGFLKKEVTILKNVDYLQGLFRLSFNQFVSPRIMKFLYGLSILWAGLIALFFVIAGFHMSRWFGIFVLFLGAPLIFLLMVIYSRVFLEMILSIFRMADHLAEHPTDIGLANIEDPQESKDSIQWNI